MTKKARGRCASIVGIACALFMLINDIVYNDEFLLARIMGDVGLGLFGCFLFYGNREKKAENNGVNK